MRYLIQIEPTKAEEVKRQLDVVDIKVVDHVFDYIVVDIDPALVPKVKTLPYVIDVIEDRPVGVVNQFKTLLDILPAMPWEGPPVPRGMILEAREKLPPYPIPINKKMETFLKLAKNPLTLHQAFTYAAAETKERWVTGDSRKMVGADVAEKEGVRGKGVKVAVLDTGVDPLTPSGPFWAGSKSSVEGQPLPYDGHGHGCITGDSKVVTTFCGAIKIKELYDKLEKKIGSQSSEIGYSVFINNEEINTIGFNNTSVKTRVKAIHKIPYHGKLYKIRTLSGQFMTTPWHPFLVKDWRSSRVRYIRADEITKSGNYYLVSGSVDLGQTQTLSFKVPYGSFGQLVRCPQCAKIVSSQGLWKHSMYKHGVFEKGEIVRESLTRFRNYSLTIDEDLAYLTGMVCGDGYLSKENHGKFVCVTPGENTTPIADVVAKLGFNHWYKNDKRTQTDKDILMIGIHCWYAMKSLGLPTGKKHSKLRIPELIMKSTSNVIHAFLAGLVDSDSYFSLIRPRLRFVTDSKDFGEDIIAVLSYLGYAPRLAHCKHRTGMSYHIALVGEDLIKFLENSSQYLRLKKVPDYSKYTLRKNRHWVSQIETLDFDGFLYDFTTDTENYLAGANGLAFIHNTHVGATVAGRPFPTPWGTVKGVAVDADVAHFKCLSSPFGFGMTSWILRSIADALEWGADIFNLSLGGKDEDYRGAPYHHIIGGLTRMGKIFVVAAGNSGPDSESIGSPGSMPDSLTIGAIDSEGKLARFSSRGLTLNKLIKPDAVNPGVFILTSTTAIMDVMGTADGPKLSAASGTSMAAPHASGVCALALQHARAKGKTLTTDHIKEALSLYGHTKNNDDGWGLLTYQMLKRYIDERL